MIRTLKVILAILVLAQVAQAQRWTTSDGGTPLNPNSGDQVDPIFCYDSDSGLIFVNNAGPNGVNDSLNGSLGGDDYGLISFILSTNATTATAVLPGFLDGVAWGDPAIFNGSVQLVGFPVSGPGFLAIDTAPVPFVRIDAGLTDADFRAASGFVEIETGLSADFGTAGSTLFSLGDALDSGAFKIVPEPGSFLLMLLAGVSLLGLRRR